MLQSLHNVLAPAKLNLFLHITGRRADGYHLLQSVFMLIDWCDTLHLDVKLDGTIQRIDLNTPLPADDLIVRAARALQSASGTSLGAEIRIDKQIPAQAGMGGGSSDAASTLLALNKLWGLNWPVSKLLPLGLALGAEFHVQDRGVERFFFQGMPQRVVVKFDEVGFTFSAIDDTGRTTGDSQTAARTRSLLSALKSDKFHS